jgi:hypothetical protein
VTTAGSSKRASEQGAELTGGEAVISCLSVGC